MWPFSKLKEKTKENSSQEFTTESFVNKISPLRVPLLFLIGFGLAALTIEIISQYVLTPKSSSRQRAELNTKKLFYLQPFSNYQDIISKNIFCPGCPIPDLEARKVEHPKDCNKADRLGGGIKLIGTIVLNVAQYSVATLTTGGEAKSFKTGDYIQGYGKVFEIRRDRLCILKNDDKLGYIELEGVPKSIETGMSSRSVVTTAGIAQNSETDFDIKRDFLTKSLSDMSVLNTAFATPYFEDNELKGYRLQSIDPGSPLLSLGLRPSDVIVKADNQPITSIAKAQEIVASASTLDSLVITVIRNGQEVSLNYKVSK
jgi:type II secretion system protein C